MSNRRHTPFTALLVLFCACAPSLAVPLSAEIRDSVGDAHLFQVASAATNVSFSFDVYLTTTFNAGNAELRFESLDAANVFQLTSRTFDSASGWGYYPLDFTTPDSLTRNPNGRSSQLIGCLSTAAYVAPGTKRYMTVNAIIKAGTPAGSYRLNVRDVIAALNAPPFTEYTGVAGQAYVVQVLPEPGTVLLIAIAGMLWARRR